MKNRILIISFSVLALASCTGKRTPATSAAGKNAPADSVPTELAVISQSATSSAPDKFADHVSYPLERPYPLADIPDKKAMLGYYDIMVDDTLRTLLGRARWHADGWRGWSLEGAGVWADQGNIYRVDYVGPSEARLWIKAVGKDMADLPEDLRAGWRPAFCLVDTADGTIYRVDQSGEASEKEIWPMTDTDATYRMCVYSPSQYPSGHPDRILEGTLQDDGSMGVRSFTFTDRHGHTIEYTYDDEGGGDDRSLTQQDAGAQPRIHPVEKTRWLDLAKKK